MNKQKITLLIIFALLVAGVGFYIWQDWQKSSSPSDERGNGDVINKSEAGNMEISADGDITVEKINPNEEGEQDGSPAADQKDDLKVKMPDLSRPLPEGADDYLVSDVKKITSELENNYDYLQNWLQLGILRKQAGDYEGAKEAWEFGALLRPDNATPLLNLANLYVYYLKDNQKAEEYYLKAINTEPDMSYAYYAAYEFYLDILGDQNKAEEVLKQGLSRETDNPQLLQQALDNL